MVLKAPEKIVEATPWDSLPCGIMISRGRTTVKSHGWELMQRHTHAAQGQVIDPPQPRVLNLSCVTANQHVNIILVAQSHKWNTHSRPCELCPHQAPLSGTRTHAWCSSGRVIDSLCGGRESFTSKGKTETGPMWVSISTQGSWTVLPATWA